MAIPFLLTSPTDFAGYHLSMAANISLTFDSGTEGAVTGLRAAAEGPAARKIH
ncbi:MAG: hypothetical protein ACETWG_00480 [Candidatus Neomarinimicrobiota bacterium]